MKKWCFHSPQTGKCMPSEAVETTQQAQCHMFPFPSNGKPHRKSVALPVAWESVPKFPFPSNGKVDSKSHLNVLFTRQVFRFHSLQTGKWIPSVRNSHTSIRSGRSFHSLQTGKWIPSFQEGEGLRDYAVLFPFPSNGKVDSKSSMVSAITLQ